MPVGTVLFYVSAVHDRSAPSSLTVPPDIAPFGDPSMLPPMNDSVFRAHHDVLVSVQNNVCVPRKPLSVF